MRKLFFCCLLVPFSLTSCRPLTWSVVVCGAVGEVERDILLRLDA